MKPQSFQTQGVWLVLTAAVLWGTTGTTQELAPEGAQPISVGATRLIVGGVALLGFAAWRGTLRHGKRWPVASTLIAAFSMAAYQLLFFGGVARTGVAVGTIVGIGSSPLLAGAIGYVVRGERPGSRWVVATFFSIIGCALLVADRESIHVDAGGILMAVLAGAAYAVFTVISKGMLEGRDPQAVMAVTFCLGALLLLPLIFTVDMSWILSPGGLTVAFYLGFVTVAIAYSLFAQGLQRIPVSTAATLTLAEPLTAGFLGIFVLGENLTLVTAVGIGLIFAGLALLTLRRRETSLGTSAIL